MKPDRGVSVVTAGSSFVSLLWLGQQSPTDIHLMPLYTDRNLIPCRAWQYTSKTNKPYAFMMYKSSLVIVCEPMFTFFKYYFNKC